MKGDSLYISVSSHSIALQLVINDQHLEHAS